ncbi:MAG: DNA ligase D [Comamonadaceae bacterium]|nr:MAG: DNA ligase D [Comamonadaceae bacterium]
MANEDLLKTYKSKRNFNITSEPAEGGDAIEGALQFVVQKHWASRLHYDFRLELDGTMKSWAVPKGPSYDTADKRMAVHVEDHPISYNSFEGTIPEKQYGAGKVIIWDKGTWVPVGDARQGYRDGKLKFELRGHKLKGHWTLVRMKGKGEKQEPWLLIKEKDEYVRPSSEFSVVDEMPDSVAKLKPAKPAGAKAATRASTKASTKAPAAKAGSRASSPASQVMEGARKAALPETFKPQLATLVDAPPGDASEWVYEIKFDGYRLLARLDKGKVQLFTRNGHDWTHKMPALAESLAKLPVKSAWLDGEIIVSGESGTPDFQLLQNAFDAGHTSKIVYYVFDMPHCEGLDLTGTPLEARRQALQTVMKSVKAANLRFSEVFDAAAGDVVHSACAIGLEGVIGKRRGSTYAQRRSADWIKLKCGLRQEFVIGGYTDPKGSRTGLGSLLLGVHDAKGKLLYAGNVGTGFNEKTLRSVKEALDAVAADKSPFAERTDNDSRAHWVKPQLLAEVSFGEWTRDGRIRHSVFQGLRTDKSAKVIVRERAVHEPVTSKGARASGKASAAKAATTKESMSRSATPTSPATPPAGASILPAGLKVSHPDRVIDPTTGVTKIELVRFYALVAPLMMPHLKGRPVSLVRATNGIQGELFFQKHPDTTKLPGVSKLDQKLDPGHERLVEIATPEGLTSSAQFNVIEFHTWNGVKSRIDRPDRMTFDLDPGEGVGWPQMQEAAVLVRTLLSELGLVSFLKTSGGKGLHVVVPVKRLHDWDTVKDFSQAIVQHLAQTIPQRFVAKSGPKNRVGKIFVDYLRNGFGATTVCAWSARARPGLGVSVPVGWDELEGLKSSSDWTVQNIHTRLDSANLPWKDYDASTQGLTAAMKILGFGK